MKLSDYDRKRLKEIYAPEVVGVPPTCACRDLVMLDNDEIRHYGYKVKNGDFQAIYYSSCNYGLSWREFPLSDKHPSSCVKSPWSGDWLTALSWSGRIAHDYYLKILRDCPEDGVYLFRSKNGIDGDFTSDLIFKGNANGMRQPLALTKRKRWIIAFEYIENYKASAAVLYSDDDGKNWEFVPIENTPAHLPQWPHKGERWQNYGIEPTVAELSDGRLYMLLRTSQDQHYESYSEDGGESWSKPVPSRFYSTLTMPTLFTLRDGRLLAFWNNATPLPEFDHQTIVGLNEGECNGGSEDVFTNRDVIHAAISEDDGKTWCGFREIYLNDLRNAVDFRRHGGSEDSLDKSVHQSQAVELPEGKVLLVFGQHKVCARMVIFDPDWLYAKERSDNFKDGLVNWSVQQYLKSPAGNYRGVGGHCAFNRRAGASLVPNPDCWYKEVLQIARHPDERLLFEKEGAVWNFPAGDEGILELRFKLQAGSAGFQLCLLDRWFNPVDPVVSHFSAFVLTMDAGGFLNSSAKAEVGCWNDLKISWDLKSQTAAVYLNEKKTDLTLKLNFPAVNGISYCHLQSIADNTDVHGVLIENISAKIK
jgi:hypothetical protein